MPIPSSLVVRHVFAALTLAAPALHAAQADTEEAPAPVPLHRHDHDAPAADTAQPAEKQADEAAEAEQDKDKQEANEAEIRRQINELEQEMQKARQKLQQQAQQEREKAEKSKREAVEQITLPDEPTREQCEAYMDELREAAKIRRGSYSSRDPIVDKLKALPPEHYDLLIAEMSSSSPLRYFANYALRGTDLETLRERFTESLKTNPNNIGVIVMNGWSQDVRQEILDYIQSDGATISPAWFQAAVEVADPSLYPRLHEITINSRYANKFVEMLEALPDYDLAYTVNTCWDLAGKNEIPVSQSYFINRAVELGNIDALGMLVGQLSSTSSYMYSSSNYNTRRVEVLKYIAYRGSNKEIMAWFNQNRDALVFDNQHKRFILPDEQ